jgi:drug/metabolite transporter (DMT)-like permease
MADRRGLLDPRQLVLSLLLLLVTAVWGWTFTTVKEAVSGYSVLGFLSLRFAIAGAVLAPLAWRRTTRATWRAGVIVGLVLAGSYLLQTYGVRFTSASNSGLITGLFVVCAPLCNWVAFRVPTTAETWLSVLLSVFGMAMLTGGIQHVGLGDSLTLACAVGFGLHIAVLDRFAPENDAVGLAFVQLVVSSAVFASAWVAVEPLVLPPPAVWHAIIGTALLASAGGFYVQTLAQRELPVVRTAVLLAMEPVFAALFGCLLARDRLSGRQFVGAAVMVVAVVLVEVLPAAKRAVRGNGGA